MYQRDRPGPRALVDGGVEAELGQVEPRRLQRQRHIDGGAALVDGKADIDARHHPRAKARDTAHGAPLVTDIVNLRTCAGGDAVELAPGPVTRTVVDRLGGTAAARIGAGFAD